ncbi:hypothetical protein SVIOM74S_08866 [Streptomyces violarus]
MGVGGAGVEEWCDLVVLELEDDFGELGDAGGGFGVAEVGFDGADVDGAAGVGEHFAQGA